MQQARCISDPSSRSSSQGGDGGGLKRLLHAQTTMIIIIILFIFYTLANSQVSAAACRVAGLGSGKHSHRQTGSSVGHSNWF